MLAFSASWKSFRGMRANIFLSHFSTACHYSSLFPADLCLAALFQIGYFCVSKLTEQLQQRSLHLLKFFKVLIVNYKVITNYSVTDTGSTACLQWSHAPWNMLATMTWELLYPSQLHCRGRKGFNDHPGYRWARIISRLTAALKAHIILRIFKQDILNEGGVLYESLQYHMIFSTKYGNLIRVSIYDNQREKKDWERLTVPSGQLSSLSKSLVALDQPYIRQNSDLCLGTLKIIECHGTLGLVSKRIKPPMLNQCPNQKNLL